MPSLGRLCPRRAGYRLRLDLASGHAFSSQLKVAKWRSLLILPQCFRLSILVTVAIAIAVALRH
ncbi:MAG: hypothetical protein F6J93_22165 [Oscillatoria sp. SIO1A7]|nr:hypothetical protein [Oscillatoria sp. SIO1A7]